METSTTDTLHGQLQAFAHVLNALVSTLDRLPAAKVAVYLAIEAESLRAAANLSAQDEVTLQLLTAYRDLAHAAG